MSTDSVASSEAATACLSRRPRVLSTFSGAGGLDLGLEAAGFETIGTLETNEAARATLRLNRPKWPLLEPADVMRACVELTPADLGLMRGDLELLAGGPPCQPFSKAAQWRGASRVGLADDRGKAILGFLGLVETFLPRFVMVENVPGFLRGPVSAREVVAEEFARINAEHGTAYGLEPHFINAADYGVPQRRQRLILVADREGAVPGLPLPTHAGRPLTAWDALHDLPRTTVDSEIEGYEPQGWAKLLPCIPEGGNYLHLTDRGGGEPLFGYRTRYWSFLLKLAKDQPAWTLAASPGPSTGPFHWEDRPLTVRERMRLQTFPDDWRLMGSVRDQVRMVGNATPPVLAEVVGRVLVRKLTPDLVPGRALLVRDRAGDTPPTATRTRPVPDEFRHLVGKHAAHAGTGLGPAPRTPVR